MPKATDTTISTTMIVRIRSRDGLERVSIPDPSTTTLPVLQTLIESQLNVPVPAQTLSLNQNLLLAKTPEQALQFSSDLPPDVPLPTLGLRHGSVVYLAYSGERHVPGSAVIPADSFGKKMTMDDLIARQMRITRQENPHLDSVSFDRSAADVFQRYANETLAFAVKRGGILYGRVEEGKVEVDFIYEPPQQGAEEELLLLRDSEEEKIVEAIAHGLGMTKVGFIFTQSVGRTKGDYTMSGREVLQVVELQADAGIKGWVTAIVKLEVNEDGGANVHFEAFQMSDMCVRLFKEGWFVTQVEEGADPKLSKMNKDVVVGGKDVREVDNDFFIVPVKISDHQGPLSCTFPVENRITTVTLTALKRHLERNKHLSYVKRVSDFHLLVLLAKFLDINADVPTLTACVLGQTSVPDGYQLIIESFANAS